jgi:hypothetical protein
MAVKTFTDNTSLPASDINEYLTNSGLVYISSTTIGSAVASVTVSNCFSSTFDTYRIVVHGSGSASSNENGIMTLNGGTTEYYGGLIYGLAAGVNPLLAAHNNTANWPYAFYSSIVSGVVATIEVHNPNLAEYTMIQSTYWNTGGFGTFTGVRGANTQHTGFTLQPTTGTITGNTITVYGYRKA